MKKWILIFISTVVLANLAAHGLKKLMPETVGPVFQLFETKNSAITTTIEDVKIKPLEMPKNTITIKPTPVLNNLAQGKKEKKSQLVVAQKEEEKKRRKKRKKKEEKAATKKPEISVTKLVAVEKPKAKVDETLGLISVVTGFQKKENTPVAAATELPAKVDIQYWAKLLTEQPTSTNLKNFVALYKARKINAKDYYSVASLLQKSTNKEARRLSILASSIEPHAEAFEILANEKYNETDSELQTIANARLLVYKDAKYLSFLILPLKAGDVFAKIEAASITGQIVATFNSQPQSITAEARQSLNLIAGLLTSFSQNSNAQLQALSLQTLSAINRILGVVA